MDLTVNRSAKEFLHKKFHVWYSEQVEQKLIKSDTRIVDTKISVMKPIGASWLKSLYAYITRRKIKQLLRMVLRLPEF